MVSHNKISYCLTGIAMGGTPALAGAIAATPQNNDSLWMWLVGGLCTVLFTVSMFVLNKVDKNQTRLFELHSEQNEKIHGLALRLTEVETGIEYCEPCNSHRHRRSTDT